MRRAEYLKLTTAGRANKRKPAPKTRPESRLAALEREHPEWFSGSHFYAPVRAWVSMQHEPQGWSSTNFNISKAGTAARERDLASEDVFTRARARGDLGGFPIRRFRA